MEQDESALVKQALQHAREQLARHGKILPAAYMLVRNNPQTGATLTHPTAIASERKAAFASKADYLEFLSAMRGEARRLAAVAVALAGEAQAEIETERGNEIRRVWYLRVEDQQGVHQMHAAITRDASGQFVLGSLLAVTDAADELDQALLPS
jgi:hypothetical protein